MFSPYDKIPVCTCDTAGMGHGMPRCAKIHYRTRTRTTRFPVPVTIPRDRCGGEVGVCVPEVGLSVLGLPELAFGLDRLSGPISVGASAANHQENQKKTYFGLILTWCAYRSNKLAKHK